MVTACVSMPATETSDAGDRRALRRSRLALFLMVLGFYLSALNVTNTDSYLALPTAVSIFHSGDFSLDEFVSPKLQDHYGYIRLHGQAYDYFPWADALLFVPAVVLVDIAGELGIGEGATALVEGNRMGPVQLATAGLTTALAVLVVATVAYESLSGSPRTRRRASFVVGTVFALGTSAWSTTSRALWQHGPSMLAIAVALLAATRLQRGHRSAVSATVLGAAVASAYAFRPTNALAVVGFSLFVAVSHRDRLPSFLSGLIAVLAAFVAVNVASFDRVLPPYFAPGRISLHPDYLTALAANLVSPARGLLLFSPIVALSIVGFALQLRNRRLRPLDVVAAGCVLAHLLVVSAQNEGWWAGHAFGPRFMSDVLPLLAYLALPAVGALLVGLRVRHPSGPVRAAAGAAAGVALLSIAVNAQGAYLRSSTCWNVVPVNIDREPRRVWDFGNPQILAGYRAIAREGLPAAAVGPCQGRDVTPVAPRVSS